METTGTTKYTIHLNLYVTIDVPNELIQHESFNEHYSILDLASNDIAPHLPTNASLHYPTPYPTDARIRSLICQSDALVTVWPS